LTAGPAPRVHYFPKTGWLMLVPTVVRLLIQIKARGSAVAIAAAREPARAG
jgi:hypothetical protein